MAVSLDFLSVLTASEIHSLVLILEMELLSKKLRYRRMTTMNALVEACEFRERVAEVFVNEFGRIEEDLVGSGLMDSLKAIDISLLLENKFGVPLEDLSMADMVTLSLLTARIKQIVENGKIGEAR
jgi:acyl carrier protein